MKLSSIGYSLRDAFRSLWRNKFMTLASVATVAISMVILGAAWILVLNTEYLASTMESELEINVYLEKELTRDKALEMKDKIQKISGVEEAFFVPKEEGLEAMEERFGEDSDLLQSLGGVNPLPDVYRIKSHDADFVPQIASELAVLEGIETVRYGQGFVEKLLSLTDWLRTVGLGVIFAVGLAAIFLIATTIRLTVFARRREVTIMKLVGATNWYIRWPFFLEGMIIGFSGAFLAVMSIYFIYDQLVQNISVMVSFVPIMTDQEVLYNIYKNLLLMGTGIGALGSAVSLHRFLKV